LEQEIFNRLVGTIHSYVRPHFRRRPYVGADRLLVGICHSVRKQQIRSSPNGKNQIFWISNKVDTLVLGNFNGFPGESYVPQQCVFGQQHAAIIVLTGPNMAGKSALLRQTGLTVLLAQMGFLRTG